MKFSLCSVILDQCIKAIPTDRAFIMYMYADLANVAQSHHRIRLSKCIQKDLKIWQQFLNKFSGISCAGPSCSKRR